MNRIYKRSFFAAGMAIILLLGMLAFVVQYFLKAGQWVTFSNSPHVYEGGRIKAELCMTDRSGTLLYRNPDEYAESAALRRAALHLTGDRQGNIIAPVFTSYLDQLIGYSKLNGTYNSEPERASLRLSISAEAQKAALEAMGSYKGAVGVYNYKTGEILCALSSPSFDPDTPPDRQTVEADPAYDGVYINRFLSSRYTPGSIFKLVTTAAALETLPDVQSRSWHCDGELALGENKVTCPKAHGDVTLSDALAQSCNCCFAQLALELGKGTLERYSEQTGILDSLEFDGCKTRRGSFDLDGAIDIDIAWAGIGQGSGAFNDLINPCQFMTYMGAIANGGQAAKPYLAAQVQNGDRVRYTASTQLLDRALDAQTAQTLKEMMRNNVQTMYGAINVPNVCAKSGTAEVGTSSENTATFAGFIDSEDYPLAFIVIVEQGGAGSQTAAPIANTVLWRCMEVLDGE